MRRRRLSRQPYEPIGWALPPLSLVRCRRKWSRPHTISHGSSSSSTLPKAPCRSARRAGQCRSLRPVPPCAPSRQSSRFQVFAQGSSSRCRTTGEARCEYRHAHAVRRTRKIGRRNWRRPGNLHLEFARRSPVARQRDMMILKVDPGASCAWIALSSSGCSGSVTSLFQSLSSDTHGEFVGVKAGMADQGEDLTGVRVHGDQSAIAVAHGLFGGCVEYPDRWSDRSACPGTAGSRPRTPTSRPWLSTIRSWEPSWPRSSES